MALTLTSPLIGTITLDGASVPLSLTNAGRTARYTFSGTSGQWLSLGLTSVTISSSTVTLLKPDGTTLSTDVSGTVTINAAAIPVRISRAGQNARYTFAGTASQQATVKMTGNTLGSVTVYLYTPSGALQTGTTNSAASFNLSTVTLATTGTYTITINPQTTATGGLNLQVTSP